MKDALADGKFGPVRGFAEGLFADGGEGVRALVEEVVQALIGSDADEHFGAPWNAEGFPRPNGYRNGLKRRELRTRMGTLKLRMLLQSMASACRWCAWPKSIPPFGEWLLDSGDEFLDRCSEIP